MNILKEGKIIWIKRRDHNELKRYSRKYGVPIHTLISRLLDSYFSDIINSMNDFDRCRDFLIKQGYEPDQTKEPNI